MCIQLRHDLKHRRGGAADRGCPSSQSHAGCRVWIGPRRGCGLVVRWDLTRQWTMRCSCPAAIQRHAPRVTDAARRALLSCSEGSLCARGWIFTNRYHFPAARVAPPSCHGDTRQEYQLLLCECFRRTHQRVTRCRLSSRATRWPNPLCASLPMYVGFVLSVALAYWTTCSHNSLTTRFECRVAVVRGGLRAALCNCSQCA